MIKFKLCPSDRWIGQKTSNLSLDHENQACVCGFESHLGHMCICENCNRNHDGSYGSGRFCSSSCARSFSSKSISDESRKRRSENNRIASQRRMKEAIKNGFVPFRPKNVTDEEWKRIQHEKAIKWNRSSKKYSHISRIVSEEEKDKIRIGQEKARKDGKVFGFGYIGGNNRAVSPGENLWRKLLEENDFVFEQEKKIKQSDVGISNGSYYSLDFFLTDFNVDLEIDGSEHKTIEKLVIHDKERNEALLQNGISVVRIAYDKVFSNEHILQQLETLKAFLKTKNNTHAIHYIE